MKKLTTTFLFLILLSSTFYTQQVKFSEGKDGEKTNLLLSNPKLNFSLTIEKGKIINDRLETTKEWSTQFGNSRVTLETDADFAFNVMYTDWRAPGKQNNADNPVLINKSLFEYKKHRTQSYDDGSKELIIELTGHEMFIEAEVNYRLSPNDFYIKKKISIKDTSGIGHFLRFAYPVYSVVDNSYDLVKKGDFGQPVAMTTGSGGAFFGLEYPGSINQLTIDNDDKTVIKCGQEFGEKIGADLINSDWAVIGLTPDENVKNWFMNYVDDIRIAKLEPFTLYNSWYDLRSAEYPKVPSENVMNEENCMRIIKLIRENMIEKNDIKIDAFVLDDGWDIYKSDWVLRDKQFPNGFTPLVSELKKSNTSLGIWFGPTGGYSFRMDRVNWMREHGYETVGKGKDYEMLCLAGKNYSALFEKRVTDFVKNYNVGFYKWDGIQFSCSEPDHGHPIDIYSRRAVLESLIGKIKAVRDLNPNIFLNITSGTWLSPWWVKYTNQIWMDGGDYGYADVPSISPRDAAITYRDMVLYEDFKEKDLWFPIANLMTHGIIKGKLQMLGGEDEPLEKFTDESLIYFARGVSMWELYISPDILTEGEWSAMSKSIHWARDKFDILKHTFMIGGDPKKGEAYGYVHFSGDKGIMTIRNPVVQSGELEFKIDHALGFAEDVDSLVIERTYPTKWISPKLYSSEDRIEIKLDGYETAVYEIYPFKNAKEPLLAGVRFDEQIESEKRKVVHVYEITGDAKLLNPSIVDSFIIADSNYNIKDLSLPEVKQNSILLDYDLGTDREDLYYEISGKLKIDSSMVKSEISLLLKPQEDYLNKPVPDVSFIVNGEELKVKVNNQKGRWDWYTIASGMGNQNIKIIFKGNDKCKEWEGEAAIWLTGLQRQKSVQVNIKSKNSIDKRIMPPSPFQNGEVKRIKFIDDYTIKIN